MSNAISLLIAEAQARRATLPQAEAARPALESAVMAIRERAATN
jgi:hypothetical protein